MTTLFEMLHRKADPYKVKLIRGQKGSYGWEITVNGPDMNTVHNILKHADDDLEKRFGDNNGSNS